MLLVALLTTDSGGPIINASASLQLLNVTRRPHKFFEFNYTAGPLTTAAADISHDLRGLTHQLDGICDYTFLSFFDIGRANGADVTGQLQNALQVQLLSVLPPHHARPP